MRSSNTKLSSDVEEKRARIADESRQRRLSEEAHRRTLQREHTARIKAARSGRGGGELVGRGLRHRAELLPKPSVM